MKHSLSAAALAACLLLPAYGMAQNAAPGIVATPVPPVAVDASVGHSVAKGITFKIGTFTSGTIVYYLSTGSFAASGAMATIAAAGAFLIYIGNEYAWDRYWPNTNVSANEENFKATSSVTRNTLKFLTFKPAVTVFNLSTIYWFTGSLAATAAAGTAVGIASPVIFYINNVLWDWYDFSATTAASVKPPN